MPMNLHRIAGIAGAFLLAWLAGCATPPEPVPAKLPVAAAPLPEPMASAPAVSAPASAPAGPIVAVAVIDPLRPDVRIDPNDASADTDLWDRLRKGYAIADIDTELVRKWEQWYANRPGYVQRMTDRGGRYLFYIVEELERRGMPTDLALLPFIESAYNPQAMSHAKASGMWQFIPGTGRDFDLKQNVFRDDRRDVLASTRAALDYLQSLHGMFEDWQLALAAYNWGQGNVQRAVARNARAAKPTDYLHLRMPAETRDYVPKLQAIKNIVARPHDFGLDLPALKNHPYFLSVPIERDIDVDLAARLAGLPLDEFHQLNPQMNKPVILAAGTPQVLLPYDNANAFVRALGRHAGPLASWTAWTAPRTLRASEAARMTGASEEQLREVNRIPARMLVKAGSTLLVPRPAAHDQDVSEAVADNASLALAPERGQLRKVTFNAGRRGDTVTAVARRYKVSANDVAHWNSTNVDARFRAGQAVVVMLAPAARGANGVYKARVKAQTPAPAVATAKPVPKKAAAAAARRAVAAASPRTAKPPRKARTQVAQR